MPLRTLYLQHGWNRNGRGAFRGRALYDRFKDLSDETLLGHVVVADAELDAWREPATEALRESVVAALDPNVVFCEGGLFGQFTDEGLWKIRTAMIAKICDAGGVFIIADVDANQVYNNKASYRAAAGFLGAVVEYGRGNKREPVYASDPKRFWGGCRQILCNPGKMVMSDWLKPVYQGVPEILAALPVRLVGWDSLLASGNSDTTGTLVTDEWIDRIEACPFASVAQRGQGYVVFIAAAVSSDVWLEGCPHNTRWLTNIATFLVEAGIADKERRRSFRLSPLRVFLSHRSTDKAIVAAAGAALKEAGIDIWFDQEQLVPSRSLIEEVNAGLETMTHFALFWSQQCVDAPWVKRELNVAVTMLLEKQIPLLVVRLDATPVPAIIADLLRIEAMGWEPAQIGSQIAQAIERLSKIKRDKN